MIIFIWSWVTLTIALDAQGNSTTALSNNQETNALAIQNSLHQNTALVAHPRNRRFVFSTALLLSKIGLGLAKVGKVAALGIKTALGLKKALTFVGKGLASKGVKWTVHHGTRYVKKSVYKWVKRRTSRWVRRRGRWYKRRVTRWVKKWVRKQVRQQLTCNYKRYGNSYLPYYYPKSVGHQQFTHLKYAEAVCNQVSDCAGVGYVRSTRRYDLRSRSSRSRSHAGSVAYVKNCRYQAGGSRPRSYGPKLQLKTVRPYYRLWDDRGSGARYDGSFWCPRSRQLRYGWKSLGDTSCRQSNRRSYPCTRSLLVKQKRGETILKRPVSATRIWTDAGSGAKRDVAVYKLNPPSGYKCLGMVARSTYRGLSYGQLSRYRCVRMDYLYQTNLGRLIWTDAGSGAKQDFTSYSYASNSRTRQAGTFYGAATSNYKRVLHNTIGYAIQKDKSTF